MRGQEAYAHAAATSAAAAQALERAAAHLKTTARHYRSGEVPRACAHAFAAAGDVAKARSLLDDLATFHASKAEP